MNTHLHHTDCDMDWILGGDRVHNAVVLMEGFDHTTATLLTGKGWSLAASSMVGGRFGTGQACHMGTTGSTNSTAKLLPATYATLIVGAAISVNGFAASTTGDVLVLKSGATLTARLFVTTDAFGNFTWGVRNSGGTVIASGTTKFPQGVAASIFHYVEMKIFVNAGTPASGTCEVHVDGQTEIASTAGNFGSALMDGIQIQGTNSNGCEFDDLYIVDTTGAAPRNTFLGECRIATILATGAGAHTDWTPNASTNFSRVNEASGTFPDSDTTYNSDATVGHIDSYAYGDIDTTGTPVYGVQVNMYARKDDAGTRQIAPLIRQAGTDYVGTTVTVTSTYTYYSQLYNQDPTAADWTAANVNADEFGVKTIA